MKHLFGFLLLLTSISIHAQDSFAEYLETTQPASLEELASELMKPKYADEIKGDGFYLPDYVETAQMWSKYSEADIAAWKKSVQYLMDAGYLLSATSKKSYEPIFYLTGPNYSYLSTEEGDNQYLLHTSLFDLGAESDFNMDGSYLEWVLTGEEANGPIVEAYLEDFETWDIDRKRNWLFPFFATDMEYMMPDLLTKFLNGDYFDVNLRTRNGKESLFDAAVRGGNYYGAVALMENGFDVNQRCFDCNGETPLHVVVAVEDSYMGVELIYELILKMLAKGADPDLRDMKTLTPIHWAIKMKNEIAFEAFMSDEVNFNVNLLTGKNLNYVEYFEKNWTDDREDDYFIMLLNKTKLKPTPNKEEAKQLKEEAKKKKEEAKKAKKGKKK